MPTIIGVVFFCFGLYYFLRKEDCLLGLLLIASIFQAASALNIAERGIQPYYVIALFIIARAIINWALGIAPKKPVPQRNWLLLFGVIAAASALISPVLFAGIPIYDPQVGIDAGLLIRPPLHLSLNNAAQGGYLTLQIATVFAVLSLDFSAKKTRAAYLWAFYLVVFIIFGQLFTQLAGIPFLDSLIRNNPGYAIFAPESTGMRVPGPFAEASFAGALLAMFCIGFIAEYLDGKGSVIRVIVALASTGVVASSGAMFTLVLLTFTLVIRSHPFRIPYYINVRKAKRLLWTLLLIAAPLALILFASADYSERLAALTVSKGDSSSFIDRTAADLYAIQLLIQTHGIGVGLGSNRASSFVASLLSNVGIVGFLAFAIFLVRLLARLSEGYSWFSWAALALLLTMSFDIPEVTFPTLWITIMLAAQYNNVRLTARSSVNKAKIAIAQ